MAHGFLQGMWFSKNQGWKLADGFLQGMCFSKNQGWKLILRN